MNYTTWHVMDATQFAVEKHDGVRRKYTNEPYVIHPIRVSKAVWETLVGGSAYPEGRKVAAVMAAVLHDTLEDTHTTVEELDERFGYEVRKLVEEVTEPSRPEDGNRALRKKMDCEYYGKASYEGKTIKLADSLDNLREILRHDAAFAKIYMPEMRQRLPYLMGGHEGLRKELEKLVNAYFFLYGEH
jgi:(p)ppGpp synthase/HD superfamily hydrolase